MESISSTACDICHGRGIKKKVRTICKECREFYCKDCSDSHLLLKATRNHVLIDLLSTYCVICLGKGIESNVRTVCKDCREFYCKECSELHTLMKATRTHKLIDLDLQDARDPPLKNAASGETELSSDFLQYLTVKESTELNPAQVAVEDGACVQEKRKRLEERAYADNIKATKFGEFSVWERRDRGEVFTWGILAMADKVIISDMNNNRLKLFDQTGKFLSSVDLYKYARGITRVDNNTFATVGEKKNKVQLWTLLNASMRRMDTAYDVEYDSYDIHYNGAYYSVLHGGDNAISVLDGKGRQVRKMVVREVFGKKITFGLGIWMDSKTHNIYVTCWGDNIGVLCLSDEALWFTPMNGTSCGITEINGALCVVCSDKCVHLISKTGKCMRKLLDRADMIDTPLRVSYDNTSHKLFLSFDLKDKVFVYQVTI